MLLSKFFEQVRYVVKMKLACILAAMAVSVSSRPQQGAEKPQCSDFADEGYNCVPFDRCDKDTKEEIIDGADNIDIRGGNRQGIQNYFWCRNPNLPND